MTKKWFGISFKFPIVKLSLREKKVFIWASIIAGLSLSYTLVFKGIFLKWKALSEEVLQKEAKLIKLRDVIETKEKIGEEYKVFKDRIKVNGSSGEDVVTDLLKDIESVAAKSAINILNIKPLPVKHERFYEKYSVQMETEGDIEKIALFLYNIDSSFKGALNIERLEIELRGKEKALKAHLLISNILTLSSPMSHKVKVKHVEKYQKEL